MSAVPSGSNSLTFYMEEDEDQEEFSQDEEDLDDPINLSILSVRTSHLKNNYSLHVRCLKFSNFVLAEFSS